MKAVLLHLPIFLICCACLSQKTFTVEAEKPEQETGLTIEDPAVDSGQDVHPDTADPVELPTLSLTLDDVFLPNNANIWNGFAPLDDGFVFSTMSQGDLRIRHYDLDMNQTMAPVTVAPEEDLQSGGIIADHAITRQEDSLYVVFSDNGGDDLYLVRTDLEGQRQDIVAVEVDGQYRTNDPHLVGDGQKICIRYGRDGAEKNVHCRSLDLSTELIHKVVEAPVFTGNLGSTQFHEGEFRCFGGALLSSGAVGLELMMTRYSADWEALDPFEVPVVESQSGEWHWAASGSAWIPEHEVWAVAYTTMPADGQADFDSRGRLAIFTSDFQLIDRVEFGDQAVHRPHLLWKSPYLFLGYDAGPVTIRRYLLNTD